MKRFLQSLVVALLPLVMVGCYEDSVGPEEPVVDGIQLSTTTLYVGYEGMMGDILVNAPYAWTASTDFSWITLYNTSGEAGESYLSIAIAANTNHFEREGSISLFCEDYNLSATISVSQAAGGVEPMTNTLATVLVRNNVYGDSYHDDFGYPTIFGTFDRAIGEIFPSNAYSGGNQYYDRFQFYHYQYAIGPNGYCGIVWYHYYRFIRCANDLISVCGNSDEYQSYRGIAKAFRALFYLDLARFYDALPAESTEKPEYMSELSAVEGLTVPYVDENTTVEIAQNNPRLPREQMFQLIFNDLNDAEYCLANYTPEKKTMPSLAVVYGLKARAYLWLGGFAEGLYDTTKYPDVLTGNAAYRKAAEYARLAISTSGCQPLTEQQYCDPISGFNSFNNAWLWGMAQSAETVISNLHSWAAHMCCEAGWGYGSGAQPGVRKATYERMSNTDFRKKLIIDPQTKEKYLSYKGVTNLTKEEWTTFGLEGKGMRTYAHLKFRPNGGEKSNGATGNVVDIPMMRVEEMYLIEAEATAHFAEATAQQLITTFMTSFRDKNYSVPTDKSVGDALVEEIIFQKRCELWGEGVLFFDFKRLNYGIHNAYEGHNTPTGLDFETNGRCPAWNICIPQKEVDLNVALQGKNNPDPSETLKAVSEQY